MTMTVLLAGLALAAEVTITPIIHSSVQIEHAGQVIQIDPWSLGDLTRAKPADLILVTDDPAHHLDPKAIQQLRKPGAPVLLPAAALSKFPEGSVIANGESKTVAGIRVEAIAAYDIKPGEPSHPKGQANGYLITLGGQRIYLAGVTECVPEVRALRNIDIAFIPMNIPVDRMTPAAAAECVNALAPKVVYVYHYDQSYASSGGRNPTPNVAATVQAFRAALARSIEFRDGNWYPSPRGASMRFGMHGKVIAQQGQRDGLVQHLLTAARLMEKAPGCELYIIGTSPTEPDAIFVTEVWRTEADHDASLSIDGVKELIAKARPLIASMEGSTRTVIAGGKGLP